MTEARQADAVRRPRWLLTGASTTLAFAQLAFVVGKGGFGLFEWGLYALLGTGTLALAARDPRYRLLPLIGLAVGLTTMLAWPAPPPAQLGLVAAGATLLFGPLAYLLAVRLPGSRSWSALALAATLLPGAIAFLRTPEALSALTWASVAVALAIAPILLARGESRGAATEIPSLPLFGGATVATLLLGFAITQGVPARWEPLGLALLTAAVAALASRVADRRLGWLALGATVAALVAITDDPGWTNQMLRLGPADGRDAASSLLLWLAPALSLAIAVWLDPLRHRAAIIATVTTVLLSIGIAQLLDPGWRPAAFVVLALALGEVARRSDRLPFRFGIGSLVTLIALLAIFPFGILALGVIGRVWVAEPILHGDLPSSLSALQLLILPGFGLLALAQRGATPRRLVIVFGAAALAAGLYVLLKQPFAIATTADFVARGLPERTLITLLLFAAAAALYRLRPAEPTAARLLAGLAVLRFVGLDLLIYNPVLVPQAVGGIPLANWLLPAFALPAVWIGLIRARGPGLPAPVRTGLDIARMAAVLAFALLSVRQLFHGSSLASGDVSRPENYGYSVAAILVALGFLAWGARHTAQAFRIGSLVLLLGAVGKVFLLDAAALDGLLRIASFLGLGVTLIGVSWFFTRHVFAKEAATAAPT